MSSEKKSSTINVNVNKLTNKPSNSTSKSKKIDLGAASNFGKATDIDINSPTHRNTHNEEVFSPTNNNYTSAGQNDLIDDLFSSSPAPAAPHQQQQQDLDDFDPRSDETQEFGDFNSAFGAGQSTAIPTKSNRPKPPSISAGDDEFADFSSAFTGSGVVDSNTQNNHHQQNVIANNANDLLFNANNVNHTLDNSTFNNQSLNIDLFGGNLSTIASPVPTNTLAADLLSDFGGLSINTSNGE